MREKRWWIWGGALLVAWTLPAILTSTQLQLQLEARGRAASWPNLFVAQLAVWWTWALLTPVVIWMSARFPLGRGEHVRNIGMHVLGGFAAAWLVPAVSTPFLILFEGRVLTWEAWADGIVGGLTVRFTPDFLIYWALVGGSHAVRYYRSARDAEVHTAELETQLARAELEALRMRLDPHFLFNTLHTAVALVREDDREGAEQVLTSLGEILRATLPRGGESRKWEVPLHEELELTERVLDIAATRYPDLEVERDFGEGALDVSVPPLVLQPLVENALRHGLGGEADAHRIAIRARLDVGRLQVEVEDDGPGPDVSSSEGIGLTTTRERLERLYGEEAELHLGRGRLGGGLATLVIPVRRNHPRTGEHPPRASTRE